MRAVLQFRRVGHTMAEPVTHSGSDDDMARSIRFCGICNVFGDVALLQILCQFVFGHAQRISLALPNGEPRLPSMQYVLHLLASCQQLMMSHRSMTRQWQAQFQLDEEYEYETEAKHGSIFSSSPEPDCFAEDAYYARQQNGPDRDGAWDSDFEEPRCDEHGMSDREYFYRTGLICTMAHTDSDSEPWNL